MKGAHVRIFNHHHTHFPEEPFLCFIRGQSVVDVNPHLGEDLAPENLIGGAL
jgi:hypothetical protein